MLKLSENELYKKILENFKIEDREIKCSLKINVDTNEFTFEQVSFDVDNQGVYIYRYSKEMKIHILKSEVKKPEYKAVIIKDIDENLNLEATADEIISKIKEMLKK